MDELQVKVLSSPKPYFLKSLMSWQGQLKEHGTLTSLGQRIFCSAGHGPLCLPSTTGFELMSKWEVTDRSLCSSLSPGGQVSSDTLQGSGNPLPGWPTPPLPRPPQTLHWEVQT